MRSEELPEHKQLAEDYRRARLRRIQAQTAMYAAGIPRGRLYMEGTPEFQKAQKDELRTAGELENLRLEARQKLGNMVLAANMGQTQLDQHEAARLNALINEIEADIQRITEEVIAA